MPPTIADRQPKLKITVTLDSDLVRQIDDLLGSPETRQRSRLVEEALRTWLAERARKETERQVEEYYRSLSGAERKENADWARAAARSARRAWDK